MAMDSGNNSSDEHFEDSNIKEDDDNLINLVMITRFD